LNDHKFDLDRRAPHRCLGPESRLAGALHAFAGFRLVEAFEVNSEEYGLVAGKTSPQEAA